MSFIWRLTFFRVSFIRRFPYGILDYVCSLLSSGVIFWHKSYTINVGGPNIWLTHFISIVKPKLKFLAAQTQYKHMTLLELHNVVLIKLANLIT